jgi:hypothetical protein
MTLANGVRRKSRKIALSCGYLPTILFRKPVSDLVIVTGSDESHFRSLQQFIRSAREHEKQSTLLVYDLGISPEHRQDLVSEFPGLNLREFRYQDYPDFLNTRLHAGQYAWKPVIVGDVMEEFNRPVVWMDAGNMVLKPLVALRRILASIGFYSPYSQGTISRWCHPGMLQYLKADATLLGKQNLSGGCVAVNPELEGPKALIKQWRDLALVQECIAPPGSNRSNHRQDQALLTVLAYQMGYGHRVYPFQIGYRFHRDLDGHAKNTN